MKLKNISIFGLFGMLNYNIPLDYSDTIIITGPNGYGKTMLLNIIDNIMKKILNFFMT